MKKIKSIVKYAAIFSSTVLLILSTVSCASKSQEYEYDEDADEIIFADKEAEHPAFIAPAMTDEYLGDFDPIILKNTMSLKKSGKKMKPKELTATYLVPRTNNIEVHFRTTVNKVCFIMNKEERSKLKEAAEQFINEYDTKTIERHKVNSKTAYYNSRCSFWFGLSALSNGSSKCDYWTNSEIVNKHAYFVIHFTPSRTDDGKELTPKVRMYFSPSQLKDFIEILDQEYLNSQVKELREKAYKY